MANAKDVNVTNRQSFFILGNTGSGKTTQFLTLPGRKFIYIFDPNALVSLAGHDVEYEEFLPEKVSMTVKSLSSGKGDKETKFGKTIYDQWEKDFSDKLTSGFFNDFDVIGIDSATTLLDIIMDRVLTVNGRPGSWPQQDDYGPQMLAFQSICRTLLGMNKIIYLTGHLDTIQDDVTKKIQTVPVLTGKLRIKIPLLFSSVLIATAETDADKKVSHYLTLVPDRMNPTVRSSLKIKEPKVNVTLDFSKPLESQGLGALLRK
jgi:hypothetical protein